MTELATAGTRLLLVGDDEALDILAELSRHLDYFEVARSDELPDGRLSARDHVLVGCSDADRGVKLLAEVLSRGTPGFAELLLRPSGESPGASAIVAAGALVAFRRRT